MNRFAIILLFCLLASSFAFAQKTTNRSIEGARATLIQFIQFSNQQALRSERARKLVAGEAARWDTPSFGKLSDAPDKTVLLDKNIAVGRVQWFGENNYVADMYFYLGFDRGWKIASMRRLAITGLVEQLYFELKAKKSLSQEDADTLANVELVLASDKVLKEWFLKNREALAKLNELIGSKVGSESLFINDRDKRFPEIAQSLKHLHLSGVNIQANANVEMVIGGITDNTVGFIYSPSKKPPSIDPSSYIWVEQIANNWYLFRTT
jgi:hypothetical protein